MGKTVFSFFTLNIGLYCWSMSPCPAELEAESHPLTCTKARMHKHKSSGPTTMTIKTRRKRGKTDPGLQVPGRQPYRLPSSQTCLSGLVGGEVVQGFRHIVLAFEITIRILVSGYVIFLFLGAQIIFFQNCYFSQPPSPLAQLSSSTEAGTRELSGDFDDGDDDVVMKMVMMMMMAV